MLPFQLNSKISLRSALPVGTGRGFRLPSTVTRWKTDRSDAWLLQGRRKCGWILPWSRVFNLDNEPQRQRSDLVN